MRDLAYLKLLSREYPNIRAAASDIINLQAICGLPKGTEYFFSDLHGEHEAFIYLLRSSSGIIREKIRETFGKDRGQHSQSSCDPSKAATLPDQQLLCRIKAAGNAR